MKPFSALSSSILLVVACSPGSVPTGGPEPREVRAGASEARADAAMAARLGELEARVQRIEKLMMAGGGDAEQEHRAIQGLGAQRVSPAGIAAMRNFLQNHPTDPRAEWVARECIQAYLRLGRLDEAEALIGERESIEPDSYRIHFERGALLLARRDHARAMEQFRTLANDPRWSDYERLEAEFYVGYTLLQDSSFEAAIEVFERLARQNTPEAEQRTRLLAEGAAYQLQRAIHWSQGGR